MRISQVFSAGRGGGQCTSEGYFGYYGGRYSYGEFYPDTGRWTYRPDNDYRSEPDFNGYGYSRSRSLLCPLA